MKKQLETLKKFVDNELNDLLEKSVFELDINSYAEELLSTDEYMIDGEPVYKLIRYILDIAQYIETDTVMESVLSDENYDKLNALYEQMTGHGVIGTSITSSNRPVKEHKFPELRGTLDKTHFIYDNEVPEKDSRRSLESWLRTTQKKIQNSKLEDFTPIKSLSGQKPLLASTSKYVIACDLKRDGLSSVFECHEDIIDDIVTRRDVDANIGMTVTHIIPSDSVTEIFGKSIPECMSHMNCGYGIKTEVLMKFDAFDEFCKVAPRVPKNHRSAVSMILNTMEDDYDPNWYQYLYIDPLQISCEKPLTLSDNDTENWAFVGVYNDRYQYINIKNACSSFISTDNGDILDELYIMIESRKILADDLGIPIDGAVISFLNLDVVSILGRSNNINKFQVAFKFPAGLQKTVLESVSYQVGPVAGTITPVAHVAPVKIMGNTISCVGLSNYEKLNRLQLAEGDEVIIKYDIVPTLFKDSSCKSLGNPIIEPPCDCPICHQPLTIVDATVRCTNPNCDAKLVGKLFNYVNKLNIDGIGISTLSDLVSADIIHDLPDLYELKNHKMEIVNLPGFGEKSYDNIIKSIGSKLVLYPHELLGAIGIPDIGKRIMKKICTVIPAMELLNDDPNIVDRMCNIKGIGDKTALKICQGILEKRDIIDRLLIHVSLKEYDGNLKHVLFTQCRDKKFADYLEVNGLAEVHDGYSKNIDIVIAGDGSSTKKDKAVKDGKTILSLQDAYKFFGYDV